MKKWLQEEETILLHNIATYPYNLMEAFRQTSNELNKSVYAVRIKWYGTKRNKGLRHKTISTNKSFITLSSSKKAINTKVIREGTLDNSTRVTKTLWKRFVSLFYK